MNKKTVKNIFAVAALTLPALAWAQYPDRPITIVVPTAAGGGNDAMARIISQRMGEKLKQSFIVENKAGGNGAIGTEYVAKAKPDGHTILFGYIATHGMNPALQKLRYDPVKDFEPIGLVCESPTLMVSTKNLKVDSLKSFIEESKKIPINSITLRQVMARLRILRANCSNWSLAQKCFRFPTKARHPPWLTLWVAKRRSCSPACSRPTPL